MSKTIAFFNQKGGVGKTTTVLNLATALSFNGKRVLVCDIDPQGNASSGLGLDIEQCKYSLYDVLVDKVDVRDAILKTGYQNLHLLPASTDLAASEVELASIKDREFSLKKGLSSIESTYDYIFIDCPPSLGLLSINALTCADSVLIPIQCEYYALEGVSHLIDTVELVKKGLNTNLDYEGILLTMADKRTNLSKQVSEDVRSYFKDLVYKTDIPRNVRLAEAPSFGKTIFEYSYNSTGAKAYKAFAEEFESRQK